MEYIYQRVSHIGGGRDLQLDCGGFQFVVVPLRSPTWENESVEHDFFFGILDIQAIFSDKSKTYYWVFFGILSMQFFQAKSGNH
jgi:hypothetical protein